MANVYIIKNNNIKVGLRNMSEEIVRKTIKLNKNLWDKFQEKIELEYGTTYKHTSEEIEKAIDNYIKDDITDIEKTKNIIDNLNNENTSLKEENDKLKEKTSTNTNQIHEIQNVNKKQEKTINEHEEEIKQLKLENKSMNEKIEFLEKNSSKLEEENSNQKKTINELRNENKNLEEKYISQVEETNKQVQENTKIKNKREHAQERLNKTQDELNDTLKRLEKYSFAIGQVQNMSFIDRVFNRLPEQIKELQPGSKNEED